MKKLVTIMLALAMLITCAACTNERTDTPAAPAPAGDGAQAAAPSGAGVTYVGDTNVVYNADIQEDGVKRLGVAYSTLQYDASAKLVRAYETKYSEYGFDEIVALTADGDLETQINQIQDLINQKCDVIIVNSIDKDGVAPICKQAMEKGVAIIAVDRKIGTDIYYTLETDNTSAGRDLAMTMADYCYQDGLAEGSVHVLEVIGDMSSSAVQDRNEGFETVMSYYPWMKITAQPSGTESAKIYDAVIDAMTADPTIKCIYVPGDDGITPVVSALKELNMFYDVTDPRYIYIGSVDGSLNAIEAIRAGESSFCANQRFDLFCTQILEVAENYCNGVYVNRAANNVQLSCSIIMRTNVDHLESLGVLWALN